ncbi:RluA family pseudouridine synthase [Enterobacteriaceae endosymbiont of Neohaemonia nigricornis]|uniref:RluA family pseudouridine synthase n=1 Tax=Enterobacteriaceae endosymbiont of Neohaemonia nigricornis TaxID=2675792 RepID=UPI001FE78342|nr:RluA family pseudouridine synthase [Enterobacteriaceae endosymbiont of Neohaemonia nigricornis]
MWKAQYLPLKIIYEDAYLLVIDKSINIVVHPGNKNRDNTIFNALLYNYHFLRDLPRAGIIHRLDKDTTGLMLVAKDMLTYIYLKNLLKKHKIIREYETIVYGIIKNDQIINLPIKKVYFNNIIKMIIHSTGKESITKLFVKKHFVKYTYLRVQLYTGRTHQIRTHLSYIKHGIIGDPLYKQLNISNNMLFDLINRQALHACYLKFRHPVFNNILTLYSKLPKDIQNVLDFLKKISY